MERLDKVIQSLIKKEDKSEETKKALAAVYSEAERRRKLFEGILSSIPDFVFVFDMEQHLIFANYALLKELELDWDQVYGKKIGHFELPFEDGFNDEIKKAIDSKVQVKGEIHSQDGSRAYDYIFSPITPDDKIEIIAASCRDVTELVKAEQKIDAELKDMRRLHEISTYLINNTNIDELLDEILKAGIEIMKADKGYLQIIEEDQALHVKSKHKFSQDFVDHFSVVTSASDTISPRLLNIRSNWLSLISVTTVT